MCRSALGHAQQSQENAGACALWVCVQHLTPTSRTFQQRRDRAKPQQKTAQLVRCACTGIPHTSITSEQSHINICTDPNPQLPSLGLPEHQDEALLAQDGGFQGAGREVTQGKRSECNFPCRGWEESSGQGETLIVLARLQLSPCTPTQPGPADVWCKSATGQKHPEGRWPDVQIGMGRQRKLPFPLEG